MFNEGDKVVLKYPERSIWADTNAAVLNGLLEKGKVYVVAKNSTYRDSSETRLVIEGHTEFKRWTLSTCCLVPYRKEIRRNLPDWF